MSPNAWLRWDSIRRELPPRRAGVLEVGCGQGGFAVRLAAQHDYTGVEPDSSSCEVARERLRAAGLPGEVIIGDISAVGDDEAFDVVAAFEVIEHIEDDNNALALWVDRLRPGGLLLISTPAWERRYGAADFAVGHFRRYDPDVMAAKLENVGLVEVRVRHFGMPLGYLLEASRNRIARRTGVMQEDKPIEARTARSGRFLQPSSAVTGLATRMGTWPFRQTQRLFPSMGPGLIASGRLPARDGAQG